VADRQDRARPYRYDAFISYRRLDGTDHATKLRRRLIEFKIPQQFFKTGPPERLNIYLDTIYETAEEDFFQNTIRPSLEQSGFLIVVQTPGALVARADGKQNWVAREIELYRTLPQGNRLAVALAKGSFDDPLPANLDRAFENVERVDIRRISGWNFFGSDESILPFVARLYNIPPEKMPDLRREEERRRLARLRSMLLASCTLIIVLATFLAFAIYERRQANAQRDSALARQTATQADLILRDDDTQLERAGLIAAYSLEKGPSMLSETVAQRVLALLPKTLMHFDVSGQAAHVAISPDFRYITVATDSGVLRVADTTQMREIASVSGSVTALGRNCQDVGIVVGTDTGQVVLYDYLLQSPHILGNNGATILALACSKNPKRVAVGTSNGQWAVLSLDTGATVSSSEVTGAIRAIAFSTDAKMLGLGGADGQIRVLDTETGKPILNAPLGGTVGTVAFSADGTYVAAAVLTPGTSADSQQAFVETASNPGFKAEVLRVADARIMATVNDHGSFNTILFNPVLPIAYVSSVGDYLRAVDARTGNILWSLRADGFWSLAVSPDGRYVAAGCGSRSGLHTVRILESNTGTEIARYGQTDYVAGLAFDAEGKTVTAVSFGGAIATFDPFTTEFVLRLPYPAQQIVVGKSAHYLAIASRHENRLLDARTGKDVIVCENGDQNFGRVAINVAEQWFLCAASGASLRLYRIEGSSLVWTEPILSPIDFVGFTQDAKKIIIATNGKLLIRDTTTGHPVESIAYADSPTAPGPAPSLDAAALDPNNHSIALGVAMPGASSSETRVIQMGTRREIAKIPSDFGIVLAFSPDAHFLASGSQDRKLHVTDVATGGPPWTRESETYVSSVGFSPDSKNVVTGEQGLLRIRDAVTGAELSRAIEHGSVRAITFTDDGRWLFSAATTQNDIWVTRHLRGPADLVSELCARVTRPLSKEEWQQYVGPDIPYKNPCVETRKPSR
jgi:WD40 repeat protein